MNIIIPLGGKSLRFLNEGYTTPKAMIKIFNKTMIQHVLDNISVDRDDKIYIIYHKILSLDFPDIIVYRSNNKDAHDFIQDLLENKI